MKKVILLASIVMSASVFASTNTMTSTTSLTTEAYPNKQLAYDAAFNLMDEMNSMTSAELKIALPITENNVITPSVKLSDMKVSVHEFARTPGNIEYTAVLDVDYQYQYRENKKD